MRIELLAVEALNRAGVVPDADWLRIRDAATIVDADRARQIEQESQHDVIAFLRSVTEQLGAEGRWLHYGLTSSDVLDTATAVQLRDATQVVERELTGLIGVVRRLAMEHRRTPMVGRSHGIHAEPITFGFKAAGWYAELGRDAERLLHFRFVRRAGRQCLVARERVEVGEADAVDRAVLALRDGALHLAPQDRLGRLRPEACRANSKSQNCCDGFHINGYPQRGLSFLKTGSGRRVCFRCSSPG